jgi:hypothetical protein
MKKFQLSFLFIFTLLVSCTKEESIDTKPFTNIDQCTEAMLLKYGMVPYNGQTSFTFSLDLYIMDNRAYYSTNCYTCYQLINGADCNNIEFTQKNGKRDDKRVTYFSKNTKFIKKVGVNL